MTIDQFLSSFKLVIDWMLFCVFVQLNYGYVETDDANNDERQKPIFHFKGQMFFYITHNIDMVWDGHVFEFPVCHWVEDGC